MVVGWFDFAAEAVPSCEQQNGTVCKTLIQCNGIELGPCRRLVNAEQFAHTVEPEVRMAKDPAAIKICISQITHFSRWSEIECVAPLRVHERSHFGAWTNTAARGAQEGCTSRQAARNPS